MNEGTIKWFDQLKGYGFITDSGGMDIFVAVNHIPEVNVPVLKEGDSVFYELERNDRGVYAVNVQKQF